MRRINLVELLLSNFFYYQDSFDHIQNWLTEANSFDHEGTCKILVANKVDLSDDRVITSDVGSAMAEELGIPFAETSAKTATGVEDAFSVIARQLILKKFVSNICVFK